MKKLALLSSSIFFALIGSPHVADLSKGNGVLDWRAKNDGSIK